MATRGNPAIGVRLAETHPVREWLSGRAERMMNPALAKQVVTEMGLLSGLLAEELRRQEWTLAEIGLLADACNGTVLDATYALGRVSRLAAEVFDATHGEEASWEEKHGVHPREVLDKLAALGPTASHALEDALVRWWGTQAHHDDAHTVAGWARVGVRVTLSTDDVLAALNGYDGDNLWEDVILSLDYDEAATKEVAGPGDEDVVIGGVHYTCRGEGHRWTVA